VRSDRKAQKATLVRTGSRDLRVHKEAQDLKEFRESLDQRVPRETLVRSD
jgi:hypothetical protein